MPKKQTAGHKQLGSFAPKFAELNDDFLFGEVWSRERELSKNDRNSITRSSLLTQGAFSQLKTHMKITQENGVTQV